MILCLLKFRYLLDSRPLRFGSFMNIITSAKVPHAEGTVRWLSEPLPTPHVALWWLWHLERRTMMWSINCIRPEQAQRQREVTFLLCRVMNLLKILPKSSAKPQGYSASPPTPAELHQWQLSSKAKHFKPVYPWGLVVHSKAWQLISTKVICKRS